MVSPCFLYLVSLNILDLCVHSLHQIWKYILPTISSNNFFLFLPFRNSSYTYVRFLGVFSQLTNAPAFIPSF